MDRNTALELLKKYNKEPFHILHGLTVEGTMRWYALELGFDPDFWGLCGLLHDVDFEMFPEEHCIKAPELLLKSAHPKRWCMLSAPMLTVCAAMWSLSTSWKKSCSLLMN